MRRILGWLGVGGRGEGSHPLGEVDDAAHQVEVLVRAGEIAREGGRRQEALTFYGRAIDCALEAGRTRQAEALCRRVIEIEPKVIRTRYTLTAIAVARNDVRNARKRLTEYMVAVALSRAEPVAVPHLLDLAGATANPRVRDLIADALRRAERPDLAEGVERGTAAPAASTDSRRAVRTALRGPDDLEPAPPAPG